MKISYIQSTILDMLLNIIQEIPAIRLLNSQIDVIDAGKNPVILVETDNGSFRLIIETRNNGQPRHAREALAQLVMKLGPSRENSYPIFAAPFISETTAEICRQIGAGSMDLSGNCRLAFDGIYIERTGKPNRFVSKRSLLSLYRSRSSRILRALLFDPELKWRLADLSQAAGASIGQVFNVKSALIEREWATFDKDGLQLIQPEKVIRDWGEQYERSRNRFFEFNTPEISSETETGLAQYFSSKKLRYAFTSFSAYAGFIPEADHERVFVYVDTDDEADIKQAADNLNLQSVTSGCNVSLLLPYDEGVFYGTREIGNLSVVSPVQAYLDLKGAGEEGVEAAEKIFLEVIRKEWKR